MPQTPRGLVLSPDDGATVAARAVVRFHLRAFARNEGQARVGEIEPVHQLRVATRRLRAALRLFEPVLPGRLTGPVQREIAWVAHAIGGVRDLDVLGGALAAQAARLGPELRGALGPVALSIHDQRAAAHTELVAALDSPRCKRLLDRLAAFAENGPVARSESRLGEIAPDLVRPHLRAVRRAGRRAVDETSPETLHRLRVRVKRLRYALETLRGLGGSSLRRLLARLEQLQEFLGEHQDAVTQVAWLRQWAEAAAAPPTTLLAVGAVTHELLRRARKRRLRFSARWRRVDRRKRAAQMLAELSGRSAPRERALRAVS